MAVNDKEEEGTKLANSSSELVNILGDKRLFVDNYERMSTLILSLAKVYVKSALGKGMSEGDIAFKMLMAYEMNIPMTQGLMCIYLIPTEFGGTVATISAQMMHGLILARMKNARIYIDELSNTVCKIRVKRDITDPDEKFLPISMTIEEAKRKSYVWTKNGRDKDLDKRTDADLKNNWRDSPDSMLFSRCISRGSRWRFADVIGNLYVKEVIEDVKDTKELDPDLNLGQNVEIIDQKKDLPAKQELKYVKKTSEVKKKQEVDFAETQKKEEKQPEISKEIIPADIIDLMDKLCEKRKIRSEEVRTAIDYSYSVFKTENPNADKNEFIRNYLNKRLGETIENTEAKTENDKKTEVPKPETPKKTKNSNSTLPFN